VYFYLVRKFLTMVFRYEALLWNIQAATGCPKDSFAKYTSPTSTRSSRHCGTAVVLNAHISGEYLCPWTLRVPSLPFQCWLMLYIRYMVLKDVVVPVPAVAAMDTSDFALNQ